MVTADATQVAKEQENKYGYLLQPIRDMAKNWNIDIAHELEDFLDELSNIQISFDGGKTTMNFAEAAMLIQGSACVYSRKVDYLYKLNYEVMELIMNRKKSDKKANADDDGDDDSGNVREREDEEFLSLDDCEVGKNTILRIDDVTLNVTATDIPRTPKILVKISDAEKNEFNALINRKGEVFANSSDFKMNTSIIHPSACMLLDASHIALLQHALERMQNSVRATEDQEMTTDQPVETADNVDVLPQPEDLLAADAAMDHEPAHHDDDDDNGADIADPCDPCDPADPCAMADDVDLDPGPVETVDPCQAAPAPGSRMTLRDRAAVGRPAPAVQQPVRDNWQILDAHLNESCPVKTFVKAKKNKFLMKEKKSDEPPPFVDEVCGEAFYSHSLKKPSNPNKVPKLAAFESLFWKHFKQRKQMMRKKAMEARRAGLEEVPAADEDGELENGGDEVEAPEAYVDAGGFQENDDDDDNALAEPPVFDQALEEAANANPIREMNFNLLSTQESRTGDMVGQSYEDLVRAYVDSYMNSVQEYALVTDLSKRVSEWEDKIVPRMDEEDRRERFDIHVYGSRVLDALVNKNETKRFKDVARCRDTFQVSRMFAATLQLANQYNVEISSTGDLEQGMDTMALKLLSTKRHHEELEEYRAPSLEF